LSGTTLDSVHVWNTSSGQLVTMFKDDRGFMSAEFSPDSRQILTAGCKGYQVWNADDFRMVRDLTGSESGELARFIPGSRRVLTLSAGAAAREATIRLWDAGSGKLVGDVFRGPNVRSIDFSDDGSRIGVVSDGEIHIFSSALGERLSVFPML